MPESHSDARLLKVRGLAGGHCEFDMQLERANAILLLARALNRILAQYDVRIAEPHGGAQNNAIPADAQVVVVARPTDVEGIEQLIADLEQTLRGEYEVAEPGLRLELEAGDALWDAPSDE